MNELIAYQQTVELAPIEDVAKFMLIAPEKAKAQAAEIRAMKNLGVAQEVLAQKEKEQRMLSELILDAGARIGELTRAIPKAQTGPAPKEFCDSGDTKPKTKEQIGEELGFSRTDMSRFERLADNRDLIEEEKAKAREENRQPTRTNVLEAIQLRTEGKVLEYAAEHPDESFREIAKSTGTNHQFVSRTIEKANKATTFPTGRDRKKEEEYQLLGNHDRESSAVEYTLNDLLEEMRAVNDDFLGKYKRMLKYHEKLISENAAEVATVFTELVTEFEKMEDSI